MPTFQEFHHAVVTDNEDPEQRSRIKVTCQSLTGAGLSLPMWVEADTIMYSSANGGNSLWIPDVKSTVELVVDVHDPEYDQMKHERFLSNPSPKWRHATPTKAGGVLPLNPVLKLNYPHRRGFITPAGHRIILDDKAGAMIIQSSDGHIIELSDGEIHITANGKVRISSPTELGDNATELMILGSLFKAFFNGHQHPTGVGPSGVPIVLMGDDMLSQTGNKLT